jgi:hypothetical protein
MRTLTNAKYTMICDVLKPEGATPVNADGDWQMRQDPETGDIIRVWVPASDDVGTVVNESSLAVPCLIRGVIDGGIRVAGTTQRFAELYENIDWVRMNFPPHYNITKHDRITNIRDKRTGKIMWREEELDGAPPSTFSVKGVTPTQGPFGRHVENIALLERTEVQ